VCFFFAVETEIKLRAVVVFKVKAVVSSGMEGCGVSRSNGLLRPDRTVVVQLIKGYLKGHQF
jgi:hypothetical protein